MIGGTAEKLQSSDKIASLCRIHRDWLNLRELLQSQLPGGTDVVQPRGHNLPVYICIHSE